MIFGLSYKPVWLLLRVFWTYGHHPSPAQRVAAEEGSQKDGPGTVPLAQRQFSKSGFGLFE